MSNPKTPEDTAGQRSPRPVGSAWSRRYICIACGHKGRMSASRRGDTIFCSQCLKSQPARAIKEQADTYRKEDNGDDSMWSIYNRGRADALEALLPNTALCHPAAGDGGAQKGLSK